MASFSVFLLVLLSLQPILHPSIRVCASSASDLFDAWSASHGKRYSSNEERADRLKIFEDNLAFITLHNNNLHKISNTSESPGYTLALNHFADMTHDEFKNSMLGLRVSGISPSFSGSDRSGRMMEERKGVDDGAKAVAELPDSVDWRNEGAVTNVKNQGSCGACWSFSATGAIEGINKIVTGSLVSLSEQELVDCDTSYNSGCEGGIMDYAFQFVIDNHGIDTEEDYPYEAKQKRCNKEKADRHIVTIDGYKDIPPRNENELLRAVASQPVSVGICGSERAFQFYSEGIFTGPCSTSLDHAVLIVGYGSMQGIDYWIVKNTWGTSWGKKGYIYMARNRNGDSDGMCGINLLASYPVKTSPNPPPPPRPGPKKCNLFTSCSEGETCCCSSYILGFCWSYKCCPLDSAVCCKDGVHCCPWDYPICDRETNKCLKNGGNVTAFTLLHGRESFFKKISDGLRRRSPLTDIFY